MHRPRINERHPEVVVADGPYPDLDRAGYVDHAKFHGLIHHRPMIDAGHVVIRPKVRMRIKLNYGHGSVFFCISLEDRQGDEVIAAQSDGGAVLIQNTLDVVLK